MCGRVDGPADRHRAKPRVDGRHRAAKEGILEIEASPENAPAPGAAGDRFTLRPLAAGQPYPLQGLGQTEALLYMVDYSEGGRDTSGP